MKQILSFYFLCCFGNLLFHLVPVFQSSSIQDLKFGFPIAMMFVFIIYSPLCTILAYVYKVSKINVRILRHPLLYSLSPFIIAYTITYIADMGIVFRDCLLLALFIAENITIIIWFGYQFLKKHINKELKENRQSRGQFQSRPGVGSSAKDRSVASPT